MENKKAFGHALAIFTIFIWGTTFISTKILLQAFQPVEILFPFCHGIYFTVDYESAPPAI